MEDKRLKLERKLFVEKMDEINPKNNTFEADVKKLYQIIYGYTCPYLDIKEETTSLLPRQYACLRNAFLRINDKDYEQAWWELYDFVTADSSQHLTFFEMTEICLCLEVLSNW